MTSETSLRVRFRARVQIHCPAVRIVGVPNAGKRGLWAQNQARKEGLSAGFPDDLCLWKPGRAALIEWKTAAGRLSHNQEDWLAWLVGADFPARVCRDADEGIEFLRECGAPFITVAAG